MVIIDKQVEYNVNDGEIREPATFDNVSNWQCAGKGRAGANIISHSFALFTGVTIPKGSTITACYYTLYFNSSTGSPLTSVYFELAQNPSAVSSYDDYFARLLTSGVAWDGAPANGWQNSPSLVAPLQELVNTYDLNNANIQVLHKDDGSPNNAYQRAYSRDQWAASAAKLHIEYIAPPAPEYNLNISVQGGGTTNPVPGTYQAHGTVTVTGIPSANYIFAGWQENGVIFSTDNTVDILMDTDRNITALFDVAPPLSQFNLTITIMGSGTTNPTPGSYIYNENETVNIDAIADTGWRFDHWEGDVSGTSPTVSVQMLADVNITAVFTEIPTGDPTQIISIDCKPTFECIGVRAVYSGDVGNKNSAVLEYREAGGLWKVAFPMYKDTIGVKSTITGLIIGPTEYRGSIFWLRPGTQYEIRVTFADLDGIIGTNPLTAFVTTRDDNPPIGTNYLYVAPNGNDSNPGTEALPFLTIGKAASVVNPGNTVLIRAGTYAQTSTFTRSGTPDAWITIMPYGEEDVLISGVGTLGILFLLQNTSYIRIRGIRFADSVSEAVRFFRGHDCIIEKCGFRNCHTTGDNLFGSVCVYGESDNVGAYNYLIQDNYIEYETGATKVASGITLRRTQYGVVVRQNTVTCPDNSMYDGITSWPEDERGAEAYLESCDIYDNIFTGPQDDSIQTEGGNINLRIWGNNARNCFQAIAVCPTLCGPAYVFRNIAINLLPAKSCNFSKVGKETYGFGRVFFFHNSWFTLNGQAITQSNPYVGNIVARNNIWNATRWIHEFYNNNMIGAFQNMDFDYNMMFTSNWENGVPVRGIKWYRAATPTQAGTDVGVYYLSTFRANWGQELHGIWPNIAQGGSLNDFGWANPTHGDLSLLPTSPAIDAGVVLKQFNDEDSPWPYIGNAPDMGATEYGGIPAAPYAEFSASSVSGNAPLVVNFINTSTGAISSYLWDFGDGDTSVEANPTHSFLVQGNYTVKLTVNGPGGSSSTILIITVTGAIASYTLTIAATGQGITTPTIGPHSYVQDSFIDLSAVPAAGWMFVQWEENGQTLSTEQQISVQVNSDSIITAIFEEIVLLPQQYAVTISVLGSGTTDPAPGAFTVTEGQTFAITAIPSEGYKFDHWEKDIFGVLNSVSFQVTSNMSILAVFSAIPPPPPPSASGKVVIAGIVLAAIIIPAILLRRRK